jgi:biopolymer transport protein ExbB
MLAVVESGGWIMLPLLFCSIVAAAITLERLWSLKRSHILPEHLLAKVWVWIQSGELTTERLEGLRDGSPLGRILAAALAHWDDALPEIKERMEDTGRDVTHELYRYLNTLGTIAGISPLLGLLGTVIGIMRAFASIEAHGAGDPRLLAGGVAQALITTAAGLTVAIPSLVAYRLLRGRADNLVLAMEQAALRFVDSLRHQDRRMGPP